MTPACSTIIAWADSRCICVFSDQYLFVPSIQDEQPSLTHIILLYALCFKYFLNSTAAWSSLGLFIITLYKGPIKPVRQTLKLWTLNNNNCPEDVFHAIFHSFIVCTKPIWAAACAYRGYDPTPCTKWKVFDSLRPQFLSVHFFQESECKTPPEVDENMNRTSSLLLPPYH
ncbi:hypothetical protein Tco_1336205 [Tanacetum coccineum]